MTAVLDRHQGDPPSGNTGDTTPPSGGHNARTDRRSDGASVPRWTPVALIALLVATAALYLWKLTDSNYGNEFYAAAAWAGSQSWRAWFFGALDPGSFITVDKPPASLWVTGLSVRVFGMNSFAVLAPQAIMGVASVWLVYSAIRRAVTDPRQGAVAGLLAGAVLALTPAAAMMFRFNNPDALLVLLMTVAAYCLVRAIATNSGRWLALVGVALGFAFLTKMLQGFLVLPGFALAYLLFANNGWRRRILQVVGAAVALVVSSGWFVVVTMIVPASARPYIGGSTDNSFMNLVFGYNGLGRINGGEGNGGGGGMGGAGGSFGGSTGLDRLFSSEMGNEISWLLPTALIAIAFGVYISIRSMVWKNYTGGVNRLEAASVVVWGSWLIVTGFVFSYMSGTIHPYYTVALAPAIAAMVGLGGLFAWRRRDHADGRIGMSLMIGAAVIWAIVLLDRNDYGPVWVRWLIGALGVLSVVVILAAGMLGVRKAVVAAVIVGTLTGLTGTAIFGVATANTAHTGSIPTAVHTSMSGGGMGGPGGGRPAGGTDGARTGSAPSGTAANRGGTGGSGMGGSGMGAPGMGGQSDSQLTALLQGSSATWAAAVNGSQSAASLEIATGKSIMAIGGWSSDPAPTLSQFITYVKDGKIGYYISSGSRGRPGGGTSTASEIQKWVAAHYTATTVGNSTVYTLTS